MLSQSVLVVCIHACKSQWLALLLAVDDPLFSVEDVVAGVVWSYVDASIAGIFSNGYFCRQSYYFASKWSWDTRLGQNRPLRICSAWYSGSLSFGWLSLGLAISTCRMIPNPLALLDVGSVGFSYLLSDGATASSLIFSRGMPRRLGLVIFPTVLEWLLVLPLIVACKS